MQTNSLAPSQIASVQALVHQGAIDVLGPVVDPATVHQAKFSMGTVLGLVATAGRAGVADFEQVLGDAAVSGFRPRVTMELDPEVDGAYPAKWIGKVTVRTRDGRVLQGRVDDPKGDPGNTLTRQELEDKALRLALFANAATEQEVRQLVATCWSLADAPRVGRLLPGSRA
jgi:2-methylcitrate dehydratase PrpD